MRLVDNRRTAAWDDFAEVALPDGGVSAEQVMIDDHDIGLGRALAHLDDEAVAVARTVGADTVLGGRGDVVPERQVLGQVLDFGAIAGFGVCQPPFEDADVMGLVPRSDRGRLAKGLEAMEAQVVSAALHAGRGERHAERVPEHRQVLEKDLLLKVLGTGGDEDPLAAEDRRHQIGEGLAGARARFREQHAPVSQDCGDGLGHFHLTGASLEPFERLRQRAVRREGLDGGVGQLRCSWYSGNFRHSTSICSRTARATESSSGPASTSAM